MKVLLLRSIPENSKVDKYQEVFSADDIGCESVSPIGFEFFNLRELYQCIQKPNDFSGIIFSSPRTVLSVKLCIEEHSSLNEWQTSLQDTWASLPAFSVGTSTASEAHSLGFKTVGDDSGNAEKLVQVILEKVQPKQAPLLFPCGTMRRDVIPYALKDKNISFTPCTVYKTCPEPHLKENLQKYLQENGLPHAVVFFSPSGVKFAEAVLKDLKIIPSEQCQYFAIGSTTEKAMLDHGMDISGIAEKPSPESLLKCITESGMMESRKTP